jgi:uncharacterized protein
MEMKKIVGYFCFIFFGLWLVSLGVIYIAQHQIIFQPDSLSIDYKFELDVPFEEFFLKVAEGDSINVLFIKSTKQPSRGVVLYFHGNADNLQRWAKYHTALTNRGYDVCMADYRGYGKSSGYPTAQNLYADARLLYNYLHQNHSAQDIIIYGRSLGTGIAAQLASTVPAKCLILETPYSTIECALANHIFLNKLPYSLDNQFQTLSYLPKITYPIFAFHGTSDGVISYGCAKQIIPFLKKQDQFITIAGGSHKDLSRFQAFQEGLDMALE